MAFTTFTSHDFPNYDSFKFFVNSCYISDDVKPAIKFVSSRTISLEYEPLGKSGTKIDRILSICDDDRFVFGLSDQEFERIVDEINEARKKQ